MAGGEVAISVQSCEYAVGYLTLNFGLLWSEHAQWIQLTKQETHTRNAGTFAYMAKNITDNLILGARAPMKGLDSELWAITRLKG